MSLCLLCNFLSMRTSKWCAGSGAAGRFITVLVAGGPANDFYQDTV